MSSFEGGGHLEKQDTLPNVQAFIEGGKSFGMPEFSREQVDHFAELPLEVQASILVQFAGLKESLGVVEGQKQAAYTSVLA